MGQPLQQLKRCWRRSQTEFTGIGSLHGSLGALQFDGVLRKFRRSDGLDCALGNNGMYSDLLKFER
jgi:hypothetical protein